MADFEVQSPSLGPTFFYCIDTNSNRFTVYNEMLLSITSVEEVLQVKSWYVDESEAS